MVPMNFFKSKPNLPDGEKAKVEFHLQQLVDCLGNSRFQLPVQTLGSLLDVIRADDGIKRMVALVGQHLSHDVSELSVKVTPQQLEKCGGGG